MPVAEVLANIEDVWDLKLTSADLTKPSERVVVPIYTRAVEIFTGITPETIEATQVRFLAEIADYAVSGQSAIGLPSHLLE